MGLTKELFGLYRRSPTILVLHVCGALIAWFAPDDVLTRYPVLKAVTTSVGEIFPLLSKAVEKSHFPEVTELYFALMLAATPIRLWGGGKYLYAARDKCLSSFREGWKQKLLVLTTTPLFLALGFYLLLYQGLYLELNFMPISRSRALLGVMGPLFAGGAEIFCIAGGLLWSFILFSRLLGKSMKAEQRWD